MSNLTGSRYEAVKQGGPFEVAQYEVPSPGPNEVVIRNKAVGLNPADWKMLEGPSASWPRVLGFDGAGIIEAVGSDVKGLQKGDEVLAAYKGFDNKAAAFQEYSVLQSSVVGHKPKSISFEEAASIPIGYETAIAAIYGELQIPFPFLPGSKADGPKPSKILVLGGSSAVGSAAVQLLRLALPDATILSTSSSKHHSHVQSLGANTVLDYNAGDLIDQIKKAAGGEGVEAIIDAVNAVADNPALFEVLTGPKLFAEVATGHNVKSVTEGVKHLPVIAARVMQKPGGENLFSTLSKLIEEGKYKPPLPITVVGKGWDAIGLGLLALMNKGVSGTKLVVTLE